MVIVCQKCGDRGFFESLTYCSKCHVSAEHRYCLDKLPEKLDKEVTDWICGDCAPTVLKQSPVSIPSSVPLRKSKRLKKRTKLKEKKESPLSLDKTVVVKREPLRSTQASECGVRLKKQKTNRSLETKALVQSLKQSPCPQPPEAPCCKNHDKDETLGKMISQDVGNCSEEAEFINTNTSQMVTGEPSNTSMLDANCCDLGEDRNEAHEVQGNPTEETEDSVPELAIIDPSKFSELNPRNILEFGYPVHAQPVIEPIWKGTFSIYNESFDSVEGLAAHLSSKACLKVCQQASLLPALLCPKMLRKSDVWPKSFQISDPSDDNIALYFFPENERDEKMFDCLVLNMITNELAMQTVVENAELLVFTSTELPLRHWRFNGKLYLWGVFRGKRVVSLSPSSQVDDQHLIENSSQERVVSSSLANDAEMREERGPSKITTWDSQSPLSPLSNSGSHGSGSG